jgi:cyclopropane fatty-acyl-phospholipid synthase-like methyltransferase
MRVTYHPAIFDIKNIEQARKVILTDEGSTTDERWETETPYLTDLIGGLVNIAANTILVDYGCGIGRIAKELIKRYGCRVIGVDISENMRALSVGYVQSNRFLSCSPEMLDALIERGFVADVAIAIWVLQHCLTPAEDIDRLRRCMKPGGNLFVLNNVYRAVPTREAAWVNDGLDIKKLLGDQFSMLQQGNLPEDKMPPALRDIIFWAFFRSR